MDENAQCLLSPHHFTYLGVCYVGDNLYLGLSSASDPQPVTMYVTQTAAVGVPEPGMLALLILGALGLTFARAYSPGHSDKRPVE